MPGKTYKWIKDSDNTVYGYVTATIPATDDSVQQVVGFIAHMDTSPDFTAHNVNPRVINNYDGKDITLNDSLGIVMTTEDTPELLKYVGQDLVVTDGTTLLGADDKAGIAEIITASEYLINSLGILVLGERTYDRNDYHRDSHSRNAHFGRLGSGGGEAGVQRDHKGSAAYSEQTGQDTGACADFGDLPGEQTPHIRADEAAGNNAPGEGHKADDYRYVLRCEYKGASNEYKAKRHKEC